VVGAAHVRGLEEVMNILRKSSTLAAALVVASAGAVFAEERVEVKVPFSFEVVKGEELPGRSV
jgi:hypothetical protein